MTPKRFQGTVWERAVLPNTSEVLFGSAFFLAALPNTIPRVFGM